MCRAPGRADGHGSCSGGKSRGNLADEPRGIAGIGSFTTSRIDWIRRPCRDPGCQQSIVGHHRDRRVADLRLARELGLRHVGHADDVAAPGTVELRFGKGRELRAFHAQIGAAAPAGDADFASAARLDAIDQSLGRDRMGERHMSNAATSRRSSSRARRCGR